MRFTDSDITNKATELFLEAVQNDLFLEHYMHGNLSLDEVTNRLHQHKVWAEGSALDALEREYEENRNSGDFS